MKILNIVAWVLVVVLGVAAGTAGFLVKKQSDRANGLQDALAQVATAVGVEEADAAAPLANKLEIVQAAIEHAQQELAATKAGLSAAQTEATEAKAQVATLTQAAQEQSAKLDSLAQEVAAKDEAMAAAQAAAAKAQEDADAALAQAGKEKAALEKDLARAQKKLAEEKARLEAELAAVQSNEESDLETVDFPLAGAEELPPVVAAPVAQPADEACPEDVSPAEFAASRILGQSPMLSLLRYNPEDQTLYVKLLDGQTLTYQDVPEGVYAAFVADPDKLDMNFRFKIQGIYKSLPPDSVVIRKYWKWQRKHRYPQGDVRVIDPPEKKVTPAPAEEADATVAD
ncbi:MAG TPA: KTSC domain-containing protein [Kiritimatiellia bacterium]|nr:KTSC domain-containing protein [Kiritimatiellia bacterium]HQF21590.1 KTSC domain-containing protein [Kiritimatiellia bacterium]HQG75652.1 KTSC domain-containing protein [Kiritimatiellia bacterium]HXK79898.1 KTSC domain-containing protein [Kiritimatiellia bacterium]